MIKNYFTYLKIWLLAVIVSAILIFVSITRLHNHQKITLAEKISNLDHIKSARIDLSKGFLYIGLADDSNSPFKKDVGLAFIKQAIASFRKSVSLNEYDQLTASEENQLAAFNQSIANFQSTLTAWNTTAPKDAKTETNLRILFYDLEQQADQIDHVLQVDINRLSAVYDTKFILSSIFAAILLITICSIVLFLILLSKRTYYKFLKNKNQLDLLSDNLVNGMIYEVAMIDGDKRQFNYLSKAVEQLYGCTVEEAKNDAALIYGKIHPDDIAGLIETEQEALAHMTTFKAEARVINPDGSIRWSYYVSQPRLDKGITSWDGIEIDITKQKHMEVELVESIKNEAAKTEQLQAIFDAIPDKIFRMSSTGVFIDYKAAVYDLYHQVDTIIGKKHEDVLPTHLVAQIDKHIKLVVQNNEVETFEYALDIPKQGLREFEARMAKSGKREVIIFVRDITDKNTNERLLQEKQQQQLLILKSMSDAYVALDRNWQYTNLNEKAGEIFNRKPKDLLGKNIWEEFPEGVGQPFHLNYEKVMHERIPIRMEEYYPPYDKWFENSINPSEYGIVIFFSDITARKKNEIALQHAKEKAEESDRLKTAFLANMSHEIRTPMNGIIGFSNLLSEPNLEETERQEYIKLIQTSGARMLNLITEIIDISKIEAGLMDVTISEVNINDQMDFAFNLLNIDAKAKALQLSYNNALPNLDAFIKTDAEKLYAILTNLVKNAIKYTDEGTVNFGYALKGENIEFYVKDTGIGIAPAQQESVFKRFIQVDIDNIQARQGAGLGLAITKAFVKLLNGTIWLESEIGKGSTFYFTIPYNRIQEDTLLQQTTANVFTAEHATNNKLALKILIADDDSISRLLLRKTIKDFASEIIEVKSGSEAVALVAEVTDFDLILMDIQMPDMNGYEATRHIRKFNKDVVIITQSAFGLNGDKEKALEAGCSEYIKKPINKLELMTLLHKHFK